MSNTIDIWHKNHTNFSRLLDLLESEIERFMQTEVPNYDLMIDILYYMTHYPDIFHHPKEDIVSAKAREHDLRIGAMADELEKQHVVLRESGAELLEHLQQIRDGGMLKRQSIEQPARTYITYFRSHMQMEESAVFPLLETVLSKEDWAAIDQMAPLEEDPLFGGGSVERRYESLHQQIVRQANTAGTP